ncbi:MAG: MFS transporter [Gammaproteobacteria bacterium]|jgi:MFS family permease|nr:MFS transporter [Gammaproteobacteria bacterium]
MNLYKGWRIVFASVVGMSTSPAPFAYATLGIFMIPFSELFGWTRTELSLCFTLLTISTAISLPIVGRLIDRMGTKKILIWSIIFLGLCMLSFPIWMSELWHIYLIYIMIGVLACGSNSVSYMKLLTVWFDRHRGLAIGITMSGIGLGYAFVPVTVQYLIDHFNWKAGYYGLAMLLFFISVPVLFFLIKEKPEESDDTGDEFTQIKLSDSGEVVQDFTMAQALRTSQFWLLFVIFVLLAFTLNGIFTHFIPLLVDRGLTPGAAALVASAKGTTVLISRVIIGYFLDKFFAPRVAAFFFFLSTLGLLLLALNINETWLFYLVAIFIGFSLGAEFDILAYLTGRYFGVSSFAEIYGVLFAAILLGISIGPIAFGYTYDLTGSYLSIINICILTNLIVVVLTFFLKRYAVEQKTG